MMKDCAIVILNWNGVDFLTRYLSALLERTPESKTQIYIIDNASSDNSHDFIKTNYPTIVWIQNKKNYGFAEGYNVGLKQIKEPILCLMNSDIEVSPNWIEPILSHFENHQDVAAIQPKIMDLKDKSKFEYAGGSGGFYDRLGYAVCRGRYFEHIETDAGQYDDITDIFWASGCCIFVRNEVFNEVGGFDGDYFAHQEEIDLCWRINNYKYRVVVLPQSVVYHFGGGSLPYGSYFKSFLNFRNSLFNLFKNLTRSQLLVILPIRLLLDGVAGLHSLIKTRSFTTIKSIIFAHFAFFRQIPKLINKRRKILHKGYPKTTSKKYILLDYYIFKCTVYSQLLN